MAGGPLFPFSAVPVTTSRSFPNVHVGAGAGFFLANASLHRLLTIVVFATALIFTLWGLILPDGGALTNGAFAKPNFYGLANLESPADGILHLRLKEADVGPSTTVRRYLGVVKMRGVNHPMDYYPLVVEKGRFAIVTK